MVMCYISLQDNAASHTTFVGVADMSARLTTVVNHMLIWLFFYNVSQSGSCYFTFLYGRNILPGIVHPRLPRRIALSPGKTTPPLPPPVGFPKGLLLKNLTLSGSLTFPANL